MRVVSPRVSEPFAFFGAMLLPRTVQSDTSRLCYFLSAFIPSDIITEIILVLLFLSIFIHIFLFLSNKTLLTRSTLLQTVPSYFKLLFNFRSNLPCPDFKVLFNGIYLSRSVFPRLVRAPLPLLPGHILKPPPPHLLLSTILVCTPRTMTY